MRTLRGKLTTPPSTSVGQIDGMKVLRVHGDVVARGTLMNLLGQLAPLLVGLATIPATVRGLGYARFGLLSLSWAILAYFAMFDLGLGRTATKFAAEAFGKGDQRSAARVLWITVALQAVIGLLSALVLVLLVPFLTQSVLTIPDSLQTEARETFYLVAVGVPVIMVSGSFMGVMEAAQRFDITNAIKAPVYAANFLLPLLGVMLGFPLPGVIALIVVVRALALGVLVYLEMRLMPALRSISLELDRLPALFTYGVWIAIASGFGPFLLYADRFVIGSVLSVAILPYYVVPYEMVARLWIVPVSLTIALFPAFSTLKGAADQRLLESLFGRGLKYVLLIMGPLTLTILLFAEPGLRLWLGADFAVRSGILLQVMAVGVLLNSLAHIPDALLQGSGRPDLSAKLILVELPVYMGALWISVAHWGLLGAAVAWTVRMAFGAVLAYVVALRVCELPRNMLAAHGALDSAVALFLLMAVAYPWRMLVKGFPLFMQAPLYVVILMIFVWFVWVRVLDGSDRSTLLGMVRIKQVKGLL